MWPSRGQNQHQNMPKNRRYTRGSIKGSAQVGACVSTRLREDPLSGMPAAIRILIRVSLHAPIRYAIRTAIRHGIRAAIHPAIRADITISELHRCPGSGEESAHGSRYARRYGGPTFCRRPRRCGSRVIGRSPGTRHHFSAGAPARYTAGRQGRDITFGPLASAPIRHRDVAFPDTTTPPDQCCGPGRCATNSSSVRRRILLRRAVPGSRFIDVDERGLHLRVTVGVDDQPALARGAIHGVPTHQPPRAFLICSLIARYAKALAITASAAADVGAVSGVASTPYSIPRNFPCNSARC